MPDAGTELHYNTPFQLLIAVILSAQCTDKRVNSITPALFKKYPTPQALSKATYNDVYTLIASCSYPNSKAHYLVDMAHMVLTKFNGEIPHTMEELVQLPGVGRKTANVLRTVAFNIPAMPVDTHVQRVAARIGLTNNAKTPLATEQQLVKHIPADKLNLTHHWLILHGRYVCKARTPLCTQCGIAQGCAYFNTHQKINLKK